MALLLPSPFQMIFEARNETTKQPVQNPRNQSLISALFGPNDGVHFRVRHGQSQSVRPFHPRTLWLWPLLRSDSGQGC